jgi:hypothetical protein
MKIPEDFSGITTYLLTLLSVMIQWKYMDLRRYPTRSLKMMPSFCEILHNERFTETIERS